MATKQLTVSAMMAASCVVAMLLGSVLGLGVYAAPLLTGMLLIPVGKRYGRTSQVLLWIVISFLCFMLVPNVEQNLMFAGFFGWYPIVYPGLQKLPGALRLLVKLALFNGIIILIEAAVLCLFMPETLGMGMLILLLVLGNVTFLLYDYLIPKSDILFHRLLKLL